MANGDSRPPHWGRHDDAPALDKHPGIFLFPERNPQVMTGNAVGVRGQSHEREAALPH
jgi:hypothetical protein